MDTVEVVCTATENINLAFYQNAIPIIRELSVGNATSADLRDVSVHLSSEPPFVTPSVWRIDRIAKDDIHHLKIVDLKLDQAFLSGLTASRRAEILLRVMSSDEQLAERKIEVNLLPPSHWGGSGAAPELLAAFVRPTDPSIDVILREAADKLSKAGRNPAIDGYKAGKKARAWELAEAIWAALVGHSIAYVLPQRASSAKDRWSASRLTYYRTRSGRASTSRSSTPPASNKPVSTPLSSLSRDTLSPACG